MVRWCSRTANDVAEWLTGHGIAYRYDAKFRIIGEFQIRPDFYLPELNVYIEYWGLDTRQYKMHPSIGLPGRSSERKHHQPGVVALARSGNYAGAGFVLRLGPA